MTTSTKQQAVKTIMSFLNKYIIKEKNSPFTASMYAGQEDPVTDEQIQKLNEIYDRYLANPTQQLCPTLINDIGQRYAKRNSMRENTQTGEQWLCPDQEDFDALCEAAQKLKLVCANPKEKTENPVDAIVVPGATESGTQRRMDTLLAYLKEHPEFKGKIFVFGTRDRRLYPFKINGNDKEAITFQILADIFNEANKDNKKVTTANAVKSYLKTKYQIIKKQKEEAKEPLLETEITKILAQEWKEETGLEWPTEYQMTCRLANTLLKGLPIETVETFKKIHDPIYDRATTSDEAIYVADKCKDGAHVGVVTNYAYQISAYQKKAEREQKNIQMAMLSPFKDIQDFKNNWGDPEVRQNQTEAQRRSTIVFEIFDAFARWMYENRQCPAAASIAAWRQKNAKGLG